MVIFKGKWTYNQINNWMETFQFNVNDLCGDKDLQFTASIWNPDEDGDSYKEIEKDIFEDVFDLHF